MNYRHAFHAGYFADVFKHLILTLILKHLCEKSKPLRYVDTHGGLGVHMLTGDEAQRTKEAEGGIVRLMAALNTVQDGEANPAALLDGYLSVLRALNPSQKSARPTVYPGSAQIAASLLRSDDRLSLCELHSDDFQVLARHFRRDQRVKVENRDGYAALKAYLPPPERRGLVLVDPPFERVDEFERLTSALRQAYKRWSTGVYGLWYPIKDVGGADAAAESEGAVADEGRLAHIQGDAAELIGAAERDPLDDAAQAGELDARLVGVDDRAVANGDVEAGARDVAAERKAAQVDGDV